MINRREPSSRRESRERRTSERRVRPRGEFVAGVRFLKAGSTAEHVLNGRLLDASSSGIRVLLNDKLQESDRILVEVKYAEDGCFNVLAEVIWVEAEENSMFQTGCELTADLTKKQHQMLQEFASTEPIEM